jgi:hypothetical protein
MYIYSVIPVPGTMNDKTRLLEQRINDRMTGQRPKIVKFKFLCMEGTLNYSSMWSIWVPLKNGLEPLNTMLDKKYLVENPLKYCLTQVTYT